MCDFYYMAASPPCRSVLMVAKALGVPMNLKTVNPLAQENLTPEYLKINPQHSIPTLVDNGFVLWESRAILSYLAEKYGKNDSLYPKDPKKRAVVNQRLYFDMGTLYQRFTDYYYPQIFLKSPGDPEKLKKIEEAFALFNTFLDGQKFAAGDQMTIADLSLLATVSSYEVGGFDFSKYPNVAQWYKSIKSSAPGHEINSAGCAEFKKFFV